MCACLPPPCCSYLHLNVLGTINRSPLTTDCYAWKIGKRSLCMLVFVSVYARERSRQRTCLKGSHNEVRLLPPLCCHVALVALQSPPPADSSLKPQQPAADRPRARAQTPWSPQQLQPRTRLTTTSIEPQRRRVQLRNAADAASAQRTHHQDDRLPSHALLRRLRLCQRQHVHEPTRCRLLRAATAQTACSTHPVATSSARHPLREPSPGLFHADRFAPLQRWWKVCSAPQQPRHRKPGWRRRQAPRTAARTAISIWEGQHWCGSASYPVHRSGAQLGRENAHDVHKVS